MSQIYLGVHLQVLLAVVLAVFCYCLVLCCIFCCRKQKKDSSEEKETIFLLPRPADSVTVTLTHSQCAQPGEQQYEELDGDVLEYLSFKSSSSPSEDDLGNLPFDPSPSGPAEPLQSSRPTFPMRRLSTPALPCSPSKASTHGRASLPSLTKLSFVSKSRQVIGRRRTVSGESFASSENSHLTAGANSQQGEPCLPHYGSNSLSVSLKPAPLLHFSLLFNSASGTLVVNILRLSGDTRRGWGVFARVCLPPLHPVPQQTAPRRRSFNQDFISQNFALEVGSVEQLCTCTLRLAVYSRDFSGLREAALGEVELACDDIEWEPDSSITYTKQLMQSQNKLKKSFSYRETVGRRKSSVGIPRMLGQLLILLQYQSLAQRIKVMVRKAENLVKLTRIPGTPDHYIVINLHQNGKIINTKETKVVSGPNPIWNAPFLFDLPPGEITKLHLLLEFIVMQGRVYTKNSILGRVMIGSDASDAGQEHWREICCLGQTETTRWHSIQSDSV